MMSTGFRRVTAVVVVLLLTGCLLADQAGVKNPETDHALSVGGPASPFDQGYIGCPSPKGIGPTYVNDVGVTAIISPSGPFCICETIRPVSCSVRNFGTADQRGVPVACHIWDSVGPTLIYNQTVNVDVDSGSTVTVNFPLGLGDISPRGYDTRLYDTCWTALATDAQPHNDTANSSVEVSAGSPEVTLSYNDGETGPNGAWSWTSPNYSLGVRFPGHCPVAKISVGLWEYPQNHGDGGPYPCTCKVRLNDGTNGMPGTEVWVQPLMLYGDANDYINYVVLDPPVVIEADSFYVTWKPQEIADPFMGADWDGPTQVGNDFGTMPGFETWSSLAIGPETDANVDLMINAYYNGHLHDMAVGSIEMPPLVVDSNSTFTPSVTFRNVGLKSRPGSAVNFWITDAAGNRICMGSGNVSALGPGESETMAFPPAITPLPGEYTDSAVITCTAHDADRSNDTLVSPLTVARPGIAGEKNVVGRASFTIAPNPLARTATVRYSLPEAGLVTLAVFDVTGRTVLSRTMAAGRVGAEALDLRELKAGVYMVKVKADGFSTTQKLVVQHQ
jgi:hypothetical protein